MNNQPQNNQQNEKKHLTSAERQALYMANAKDRLSTNRKKEKRANAIKIALAAAFTLLVIAAVISAIILNEKIWEPRRTYNKALELYNSEQYLEAYDIFVSMGSYGDAADMASDCILQNARKLSGREDVVIGSTKTMPWFSIDENGVIKFDGDVYVGDSDVVIPDVFDSILVREIADKSFYYEDFLTGIVIPPSVTKLGERSFFCCTALTSVELPDSLEEIGEYAFSGCSALVSVTFGSGLRTIKQRAFRECTALESISLPEGLTTIGVRAFNGCVSLKSISLPSTLTTVGGYAFTECTSLEKVVFHGEKGALEAACTAEDKEIILECSGLTCEP